VQQPTKMFEKRFSELQSVRVSDGERYANIVKIIKWVENVKQIHLSEDERRSLAILLNELPERLEEILHRAENVARQTDYARLPFDLWINAKKVYTESEINSLVEKNIKQRIAEYEKTIGRSLSEKELVERGLANVALHWNNEIQLLLRVHEKRQAKRCKKLKYQFYSLPEQAKIELWTIAVQKGLVTDGDKHAMQILPLLVPRMVEDFEAIIKTYKEN
jgi:hypothetical protein